MRVSEIKCESLFYNFCKSSFWRWVKWNQSSCPNRPALCCRFLGSHGVQVPSLFHHPWSCHCTLVWGIVPMLRLMPGHGLDPLMEPTSSLAGPESCHSDIRKRQPSRHIPSWHHKVLPPFHYLPFWEGGSHRLLHVIPVIWHCWVLSSCI